MIFGISKMRRSNDIINKMKEVKTIYISNKVTKSYQKLNR